MPRDSLGGKGRSYRALLPLLLGALLLSACTTSGQLQTARDQYYSGQPDAALTTLEEKPVSGRNRLLAKLDAGLIAHMAGRYTDSRDAFFDARAIIEELDKISVSEQTGAVLLNDWATSYRGEYSERLWIHSFQMMNFLLLGQAEGAAVEARQALQLYDRFGSELREDWFTRALMAISFAAADQFDSAHIEYAKLIEDLPPPYAIGGAAGLNALRAGQLEAAGRFDAGLLPASSARTEGELVVFLSNGLIPRKLAGELFVPPRTRLSFPFYPDLRAPPVHVRVAGEDADSVATVLVEVARTSLESRGKSLAARQVARAATKYQIGRAAAREDEVLGAFVQALLFLVEQADTRSWETLPGELALVRVALPAGQHDVDLSIDDGFRVHRVQLRDVNVLAGRPTFRRHHIGQR